MEEKKLSKPHAVIVPFPTQGHINPLLKLAKLLHHRGFHVTFVNTLSNHRRLLAGGGAARPPAGFCFEAISDGLQPSEASTDLAALNDATRKNCLPHFRELLARLDRSATADIPRVSCIVSDGVMSFTLEAAEEMGVPNVVFWTFGACGFLGFKLLVDLVERGVTPFKDSSYLTDGTLETRVDWQEGLENFKLKHIPAFIRTTNPQDLMLDIVKGELKASQRASAIILHTFDALEQETLNIISPMFPPIYAIGPLQLLVDSIPNEDLQSVDCSLWRQEDSCLEWLSSKEKNSVLYVNFGSIAVLSRSEILELGWGIADSNKNFLWVIRPDMVAQESGALGPDFLGEVKERGLILSWCNQERVLGHPSVGAFLTHCGWNSTIEGITAGAPFLCLPCLSEQPTNSKCVCDDWRFGLEIGKGSRREEISGAIKKLMDGEEGKEMKERAMELKSKAMEATSSPHGSSFVNLENLVREVLMAKK